jgi:hypothetical protein
MSTQLPKQRTQAPFAFTFDHPQVTAGALWNLGPSARDTRYDRISYYNPTGLAEHSSNAFAITAGKLEALTVADFTFTGEADDNLLTKVAHGLLTGDGPVRVANSGGALPTGLAAATDYYVIKADADTFSLATTRENAWAGTAIDLTGDGSGTQTLSDTSSTKRVVQIASGIDTDSDEAGTNTLLPSTWYTLTLDTDAVLSAGEEFVLLATEDGTATLPAGRFFVEGRYLQVTA